MRSTSFWSFAFAFLTACSLSVFVTGSSRPNVVYVLADDMDYGDIGYMEMGSLVHTPHLDELQTATEGVVNFARGYSGGPVCSPTRSTVLTGRNHNRNCLFGLTFPKGKLHHKPLYMLNQDQFTVAMAAKEQNYETIMVGKWHLGAFNWPNDPTIEYDPSHAGFDHWWHTVGSLHTTTVNCGAKDEWNQYCNYGHFDKDTYINEQEEKNNYFTRMHVTANSSYLCCADADAPGRTADSYQSWPEPMLGDDSDFIMDVFEQFLERRQVLEPDRPFFAYLPLHSSHAPQTATPEWTEFYERTTNLSTSVPSEWEMIDYLGCISGMDASVGRLRQLLRQYNIADDTLLWFTNDNGAKANDWRPNRAKLHGFKGTLYEGGVRVPSIVEWPAQLKHTRRNVTTPSVTSDLLPTLLDIWGVLPSERDQHGRILLSRNNITQTLDGQSMMPFLQVEPAVHSQRDAPLGFAWDIETECNLPKSYQDFSQCGRGQLPQVAIVSPDGQWKLHAIVTNGVVNRSLAQLFSMSLDMVPPGGEEENDLSAEYPALFHEMIVDAQDFLLSVYDSILQSECKCNWCSCQTDVQNVSAIPIGFHVNSTTGALICAPGQLVIVLDSNSGRATPTEDVLRAVIVGVTVISLGIAFIIFYRRHRNASYSKLSHDANRETGSISVEMDNTVTLHHDVNLSHDSISLNKDNGV